MSLSICSDCQTVEGKWREPTLKEREENGIELDAHVLPEDLVCCECDSVGSYMDIPEHDEMEARWAKLND